MIAMSPHTKVYLAKDATDMRRNFRGLTTLTESVLRQEPVSSHLFVFLNRRRDLMILYWDGTGFCIWYKRLERGSFQCTTARHNGARQSPGQWGGRERGSCRRRRHAASGSRRGVGHAGGGALVVARSLERATDVVALELGQGRTGSAMVGRRSAGLRSPTVWVLNRRGRRVVRRAVADATIAGFVPQVPADAAPSSRQARTVRASESLGAEFTF